ncbi:GNAT family N-acetyltransferase [Paenibacillus aurantius]|uniref:GNAT family N-acetyltransferase n=1 Tax=Paenibacillus aurantius TaxID=2918900 RepID=A0AA96RDZ9_9BACL|nr:GNAT family N-acetyltransferase [Paenibacillus aurantius]WNQ09956.1 GNAT family N-acetyltransferase [Paenibacillus aurantius]
MLRKRIAASDDETIIRLSRELLLPFARATNPSITVDRLEMKKRLGRGVTWVSASHGRPPDGFIVFLVRDGRLWIDLLAVSPGRQGSGRGSALLAKAEEHGRKKGCREVRVFVDESNTRAEWFYYRKGYRRVSYVQGVKCHILAKPLSQGKQAWFGGGHPPFPA